MVAPIPTGTVTFLFTDVEGSTRLWEADPDGIAASLALHDQIMRRVIEAHRGHVFSKDVNCWATSTRVLARRENALGETSSSAKRLVGILDRMPTKPMPELTKPRTVDAIAASFTPESVLCPAELEEIRSEAVSLLGESRAEVLFDRGAQLDVDQAIERARQALLDLIGGDADQAEQEGGPTT